MLPGLVGGRLDESVRECLIEENISLHHFTIQYNSNELQYTCIYIKRYISMHAYKKACCNKCIYQVKCLKYRNN